MDTHSYYHPGQVDKKNCLCCGKGISAGHQWKDSRYIFCSFVCYVKYFFWREIKGSAWLAVRKIHAAWRVFYSRSSRLPLGNSLIPLILPILTLSSIYTYTSISADNLLSPPNPENAEEKIEESAQNAYLKIGSAENMIAYNVHDEYFRVDRFKKRVTSPPKPATLGKSKPSTPDITRGSLVQNKLSITFDGGNNASDAADILHILRERNIKTTIFLTGEFIRRYPWHVKTMVEDGHEIGNHTLTHPHLTTFEKNFRHQTLAGIDREFLIKELTETSRMLKELTGVDMVPYWRAPYGEQNDEIRQWALEAGFTHIGWTTNYKTKESLDSLDWVSNEESGLYYSAEEIKDRLLNFERDAKGLRGGIILMHLGTKRKDSRVSAKLPEIIDSLENDGYMFVKVSELINSGQ